jgi:hypothetical protein
MMTLCNKRIKVVLGHDGKGPMVERGGEGAAGYRQWRWAVVRIPKVTVEHRVGAGVTTG